MKLRIFFSVLMNCYQLFCFPRETSTNEPVKLTVIFTTKVLKLGGGRGVKLGSFQSQAQRLTHWTIRAK